MRTLDKIKTKKTLILGFGRDGISTYRFLRKKYPKKQLGIADQKEERELEKAIVNELKEDKRITTHWGQNYLQSLNGYELVVKSPGIPGKLNQIKKADTYHVEFTSSTNIFLEECGGKVIGVTGTKGKSTTATLIYHILSSSGLSSVLLGNIGKPALDYLHLEGGNPFFVFEMSSHQLSDVTISPHIAVFLNIYPEHLDYYVSYNDYKRAKENITKSQNAKDYFVYNTDFPEIVDVASRSNAQKYTFSLKNKGKSGCHLVGGKVIFLKNKSKEFEFDTADLPLLGKHNIENIMAAIIAARLAGVSFQSIDASLKTFRPLEGRLENVGVYETKTFVNDTLATIPEATIAAVETFGDKKLTLILGGFDRGLSFDKLAKFLAKKKNVVGLILIGQTAIGLEKKLRENRFAGKIANLGQPSMGKIVRKAVDIAPKGGVILLSPAASSFDMFKDYKDRGEKFKNTVAKLSPPSLVD